MQDYIIIKGQDMLSVTVIIIGNGTSNLSSNLDKAVCVSLLANAFGKGMSSSVLSPVMGK